MTDLCHHFEQKCKHCGSTRGYTLSACNDCGYNQCAMRFEWVKVYVHDFHKSRSEDWYVSKHEACTAEWDYDVNHDNGRQCPYLNQRFCLMCRLPPGHDGDHSLHR